MIVNEFNMKAVVKELEKDTTLTNMIFWIFDDEIDSEETPDKPYIYVWIVSDTPDPIETKTRIEFRIISENENTSKNVIRQIDKRLVQLIWDTLNYNDEFYPRNVVVEDWFETPEPKGRQGFIREFLFYFIN